MRKLLLLTLLVSLAHALLLWATPARLQVVSRSSDALVQPTQAASFITRTLEAPALPQPISPPAAPTLAESPVRAAGVASPPVPAPVKKVLAKPVPAVTAMAAAPLAPATDTASEPAPPSPALASLQLAAASPTVDGGSKTRTEVATEARSTATAAPAPAQGSTPTRLQKMVFPQPAHLVYDGKGEEKGFLKYNASGEIWWLPDGTQYNARLEITFLLARLRTWTSKGDLTEAGLQPLRFGDKPRGAEQAAHFQRDKGIISFSSNSPDVPLQAGAQDKLSALLQLSSLVAGAPTRYSTGSTISFQAADAHRAELWDFKVGAAEALDLPGGTVTGIKFSKEPTVEFDQRIEVWLAPDMTYLPVRLRITEANSAFVDLLWRKTLKPD
jgi:hypothetical protein